MSFRKPFRALSILLLLALAGIFLLQNSEPKHAAQAVVVAAQQPPVKVELDEYGLDVTDLEAVEGKIARGQTFSELLTPHGISPEEIHAIVETAQPVFDIRRIQAGKSYRIYTDGTKARYLVYKLDAIEHVIFDLSDSLHVYEGERPVRIEQRTIAGAISNSLYGALSDADADLELAAKLAEIYAWQIDFYRIQKGDAFKVVYEQQVIDGKPVGIGDVLAANFKHADRDYLAIRFEQDGVVDYFDESGESLRKAFLKSPLKFSRMTSGYTLRRFHPVQKRWKAHLGTDYAAPTGTPIMATGDGVVTAASYTRGNGNYVKIRHNGTYTTGYLHMSKIGKGIRPGARVTQGQVIGYVGSTGLATGPHVCYRFWKHGSQVNHLKEDFPSADPVLDENRIAFEMLRDRFIPTLSPTSTSDQPAYAALDSDESPSAL